VGLWGGGRGGGGGGGGGGRGAISYLVNQLCDPSDVEGTYVSLASINQLRHQRVAISLPNLHEDIRGAIDHVRYDHWCW